MSKNVFILDHPLTGGYLQALRDKNSAPETFRTAAARLGSMLVLEISKDLPTEQQSVTTPICATHENVVDARIAIVPILRAGVAMVDPFLHFIPSAGVYFLGMYRDETTHNPVSYYNKLEEAAPADIAYIIDPMLATGGSAILAVEEMKKWGVKKIKFAGLIGAPEGVSALHSAHPDIDVHLAALDERLNENAYIVPGLGDAGDRVFNT
ncbi:MAG: uracil phosphoribosyltransferase [Alphaproteobacteria bacterium]